MESYWVPIEIESIIIRYFTPQHRSIQKSRYRPFVTSIILFYSISYIDTLLYHYTLLSHYYTELKLIERFRTLITLTIETIRILLFY